MQLNTKTTDKIVTWWTKLTGNHEVHKLLVASLYLTPARYSLAYLLTGHLPIGGVLYILGTKNGSLEKFASGNKKMLFFHTSFAAMFIGF